MSSNDDTHSQHLSIDTSIVTDRPPDWSSTMTTTTTATTVTTNGDDPMSQQQANNSTTDPSTSPGPGPGPDPDHYPLNRSATARGMHAETYWLSTHVRDGHRTYTATGALSADVASAWWWRQLHGHFVNLTRSPWYGPLAISFLGYIMAISAIPTSDHPVFLAVNFIFVVLLATIEMTRVEAHLLRRLFRHHEYWFLMLNSLLLVIASEITLIMSPPDDMSDVVRIMRICVTLPAQLLSNLLLISLDSWLLVPNYLRRGVPAIAALYMATRIIIDRSRVYNSAPELCWLFCSDSAELASTASFNLLLFCLKYFVRGLLRPGEFLIINAGEDCVLQESVDLPRLSEAMADYEQTSHRRLRYNVAGAQTRGQPVQSSHMPDKDTDDSDDSDYTGGATMSRMSVMPHADADADSKPSGVDSDIDSDVEIELGGDETDGAPRRVSTGLQPLPSYIARRRRVSYFLRTPKLFTQVQTKPVDALRTYKSRWLLNIPSLSRIAQSRYYPHVVIVYIVAMVIISNAALLPNKGALLFFFGVSLFLFVCEMTRWDNTLFWRLLRHFEFGFMAVSIVVHVISGMVETYMVKDDFDPDRYTVRLYFSYLQFLIVYGFLLFLDAMPLVSNLYKKSVVVLMLLNATRILVTQFISPPVKNPPELCHIYCSNLTKLRLSSLAIIFFFLLKYVYKSIKSPGMLIIVRSSIKYKVLEIEEVDNSSRN
jgi:hypothetical protein